jgi:hypothetical protein
LISELANLDLSALNLAKTSTEESIKAFDEEFPLYPPGSSSNFVGDRKIKDIISDLIIKQRRLFDHEGDYKNNYHRVEYRGLVSILTDRNIKITPVQHYAMLVFMVDSTNEAVTNNVDLKFENKTLCKILAESITCDKLINPEDLDDKMASNPFFITP